ncbi:MAG TPA: 4-hydroxy-tetrahydrodipicolinate reductase [Dehalococcoidia bacterium]|nr:4-hydroxy-tetrahydrodipicolinate reductase [Dehalococcoidia bacterium]
MAEKITVVVSGSGFMGREVLYAVAHSEDMEALGVVEKFAQEEFVSLPTGAGLIPMSADPELITRIKPQVVIDFSNAQWTPEIAKAALGVGASLVIGTTGLSESFLQHLASECKAKGIGAVVAPNFALGAVLMIHLGKIAAKYFDYAEIIESHQEKKLDAPSGTAVLIARELVEAHGKPFEHTMPEKEPVTGGRGAEHGGVAIHSQRMPGYVAHHEIAFGGVGQTLRIRHDSTGRESFIPGVMLAAREVLKRKELVIGLDKLIGL